MRKPKQLDAADWDEILDNVEEGVLTPEAAEAEAVRRTLRPFAFEPQFDPLKEVFWSLGMILIWIMTRDLSSVLNMHEKVRSERRRWRPVNGARNRLGKGLQVETEVAGHTLMQDEPPTPLALAEVAVAALRAGLNLEVTSYSAAFAMLVHAAMANEIQLTGVPAGINERRQIEPLQWQDLALTEPSMEIALRYSGGGVAYERVTAEGKKIRERWPSPEEPEFPNRNKVTSDAKPLPLSNVGQESKAKSLLADSLKRNPGLRKREAREMLATHGIPVSMTGFNNRVWPDARAKALLPRKAPPGRKGRSDRNQ